MENKVQNAVKGYVLKKIVDISEYRVNSSAAVFFKFFVYHIVSFYIYPLVFVIVPLLDGMPLVYNMLMVPKCNIGSIFQIGTWLATFYLILSTFLFPLPHVYPELLLIISI